MNGDSPEALVMLVQDIGDAGIAQMADTPGLAAAVDQHVASLREELGAAGRQELLRYLHRFAEDAVNRGWWPENVRDWEFVRIVALCWMMRHTA